jgi:hypothetical protein
VKLRAPSGRIPHHRIGLGRGAIRFTEANVELFLNESKSQASGERVKPRPARQKLKHLKF